MGLLARQVAGVIHAKRASHGTQVQDQHQEGQQLGFRTATLVRQLRVRVDSEQKFLRDPTADVRKASCQTPQGKDYQKVETRR